MSDDDKLFDQFCYAQASFESSRHIYRREQATGLGRRGVADILNIIERSVVHPVMEQAVADYRQNVATGGTISNKMTSSLIRQINSIADNDARLQARMLRPRARGDEAATQVSEKQDEKRRQSGKSDNLKQLKRLRQEVNDSNGISLTDKATPNQALVELGTNLDAEKAAASQALQSETQDLHEAQLQHEQRIDEC